ncbi:uncharacterized protein G2W53_019203 [Senna tora]|uniref:Uncharacterized protein n=1 Tax=Senna tora TaxID=362788 RepID=A0A834TUH3_9FABA|nr:uncharacterized protein G2W53_019203 [Senna tora]
MARDGQGDSKSRIERDDSLAIMSMPYQY